MTEAGTRGELTVIGSDGHRRCRWGGGAQADYVAYHDHEWGMAVVDEVPLFEKLCLEGFQAGLSWLTILRKRPAFRDAFDGFDPERVARFGPVDIDRLCADTGIVRHRAKILSVVNNAQRYCDLRDEGRTLSAHVWSFEPSQPHRDPTRAGSIPATSPASVALARDLKARRWSFVGPTTVYAFMQAMGLTNDHHQQCWAFDRCAAARRALPSSPALRR
jgi:DNA-3-methyladenine glycosylase I